MINPQVRASRAATYWWQSDKYTVKLFGDNALYKKCMDFNDLPANIAPIDKIENIITDWDEPADKAEIANFVKNGIVDFEQFGTCILGFNEVELMDWDDEWTNEIKEERVLDAVRAKIIANSRALYEKNNDPFWLLKWTAHDFQSDEDNLVSAALLTALEFFAIVKGVIKQANTPVPKLLEKFANSIQDAGEVTSQIASQSRIIDSQGDAVGTPLRQRGGVLDSPGTAETDKEILTPSTTDTSTNTAGEDVKSPNNKVVKQLFPQRFESSIDEAAKSDSNKEILTPSTTDTSTNTASEDVKPPMREVVKQLFPLDVKSSSDEAAESDSNEDTLKISRDTEENLYEKPSGDQEVQPYVTPIFSRARTFLNLNNLRAVWPSSMVLTMFYLSDRNIVKTTMNVMGGHPAYILQINNLASYFFKSTAQKITNSPMGQKFANRLRLRNEIESSPEVTPQKEAGSPTGVADLLSSQSENTETGLSDDYSYDKSPKTNTASIENKSPLLERLMNSASSYFPPIFSSEKSSIIEDTQQDDDRSLIIHEETEQKNEVEQQSEVERQSDDDVAAMTQAEETVPTNPLVTHQVLPGENIVPPVTIDRVARQLVSPTPVAAPQVVNRSEEAARQVTPELQRNTPANQLANSNTVRPHASLFVRRAQHNGSARGTTVVQAVTYIPRMILLAIYLAVRPLFVLLASCWNFFTSSDVSSHQRRNNHVRSSQLTKQPAIVSKAPARNTSVAASRHLQSVAAGRS